MSNIKFKAGFAAVIKSWENDYDGVSEKIVDGLTREQALAIQELLKYFASRNHSTPELVTFGNEEGTDYEYIVNDMERNHIYALYQWSNNPQYPIDFEDFLHPDFFADIVYDLVGRWSDGCYNRVVESVNFLHFPFDIYEVTL